MKSLKLSSFNQELHKRDLRDMRGLKFLLFAGSWGLFCSVQVRETTAVTPPKPKEFRDLINLRAYATPKQAFQISTITNPRRALLQRQTLAKPEKQIQRREIPFQQTFLGVPVQIENVKQTQPLPGANLYPQLPKLPPVKPLIKPNETEAERAERIHKSFDRLLTFVEIVGQVDNYVSSKWKNLVKTVSNFYETEDEPYRVSSKRIYGSCPHAQ